MYGNMHIKKILIKLSGRTWIGVSGNLAPGGRGKRRGTKQQRIRRYFCPAEYTTKTKPETNQKTKLGLVRLGLSEYSAGQQ